MEESPEVSRNPRDEDQFLPAQTRRIAVLRLDCQTTKVEQMMQLPAIGPTQGHLASVLSKHLAVGPDFRVSPEIAANLVEVVEIGSEESRPSTGAPCRDVCRKGVAVCCSRRSANRDEDRTGEGPTGRSAPDGGKTPPTIFFVDRSSTWPGRKERARKQSQSADPNSARSCPA